MAQRIHSLVDEEKLIKKQEFFEEDKEEEPSSFHFPAKFYNILQLNQAPLSKHYKCLILGIVIAILLFMIGLCYDIYIEGSYIPGRLPSAEYRQLNANLDQSDLDLRILNETEALQLPCNLTEKSKKLKNENEKLTQKVLHQNSLTKQHRKIFVFYSLFAIFITICIWIWYFILRIKGFFKQRKEEAVKRKLLMELENNIIGNPATAASATKEDNVAVEKTKSTKKKFNFGAYAIFICVGLLYTVIVSNVFAEGGGNWNLFFPACGELEKNIPGENYYDSYVRLEMAINRFQTEINITQEIISENPICDSTKILTEKLNNATKNLNEFETCKKLKHEKNRKIVTANLISYGIFLALYFYFYKYLTEEHVWYFLLAMYLEITFLVQVPFS